MYRVRCVACKVELLDTFNAPTFGYFCETLSCQSVKGKVRRIVMRVREAGCPKDLKGEFKKAGICLSGKMMSQYKRLVEIA